MSGTAGRRGAGIPLACLAVGVVISACGASADGPPTGRDPVIRVSGVGSTPSAPFILPGGDYRVNWTVTCGAAPGREPGDPSRVLDHEVVMRSHSGEVLLPLVHVLVADSTPVRNMPSPPGPPGPGPAIVDDVPAGSYLIQATTDCAWELEFEVRR